MFLLGVGCRHRDTEGPVPTEGLLQIHLHGLSAVLDGQLAHELFDLLGVVGHQCGEALGRLLGAGCLAASGDEFHVPPQDREALTRLRRNVGRKVLRIAALGELVEIEHTRTVHTETGLSRHNVLLHVGLLPVVIVTYII